MTMATSLANALSPEQRQHRGLGCVVEIGNIKHRARGFESVPNQQPPLQLASGLVTCIFLNKHHAYEHNWGNFEQRDNHMLNFIKRVCFYTGNSVFL